MDLLVTDQFDPNIFRQIREAGSGGAFFGDAPVGGYLLQQVPAEFAAYLTLVRQYFEKSPVMDYVEIGAAAGGVMRFTTELLRPRHVSVLDLGIHPDCAVFPRHFTAAAQVAECRFFSGDSHSADAARFMEGVGTSIDLAFIDGDHSYEGVSRDAQLVLPHLSSRALVAFHDAATEPGVLKYCEDIAAGRINGLRPIVKFVNNHPIFRCGIMVCQYGTNHMAPVAEGA